MTGPAVFDPQSGRLGNPVDRDSLLQANGRLGDPVNTDSLRRAAVAPSDVTRTPVSPSTRPRDFTTGAPQNVRLAVAASGTPADKLAVAQRMLPGKNARLEGDDIYFDGPDGRPTLLAPSFFSRLIKGDYNQDIGSMMGAPGGMPHLTPAGVSEGVKDFGPAAAMTAVGAIPGVGLPARMALQAAASAGGNKLSQGIAKLTNMISGTDPSQDSRTLKDHAVETALDAATGAGAELGGAMVQRVPSAIPAAIRGARQGMRSVAKVLGKGEGALPEITALGGKPSPVSNAMMRRGLTTDGGPTAPLSTVSEGTVVPQIGNAIEQTFAGGAIRDAKQRAKDQLDTGMRKLAAENGPVATPRQAALASRRVQQSAIDNLTENNDKLLARAFDGTEGGAKVGVPRVQTLLDDLNAYVKENPTAAERYGPAQERLQSIIDAAKGSSEEVDTGVLDAAGNMGKRTVVNSTPGIKVSELRNSLSDLGADIGDAKKSMSRDGVSSKSLPKLNQSYATLTGEVESALGKPTKDIALTDVLAGKGTARDAWDAQRQMIAHSHDPINPIRQEATQRMVRQGNLKRSLEFMTKGDPIEQEARLVALRRTADPQDWAAVQSHAIGTMGRDAQGTFDPAQMAEQFAKMTPGAQKVLFSPSQVDALRDYALVAKQFAENPLSKNGSVNNALFTLHQMAMGAASMVGAAAGATKGAASAAMGAAAAPAALTGGEAIVAKFMANPKLTKWLTTTYRAVQKSPTSWGAQLSRLLALKALHPEEADAIDAYYRTAKQVAVPESGNDLHQ